ncbi:AbiU2 domain-containing protein [Desulfonatronum thiodismutans]|uniref:AbiU2 domain-containing protein n=1 Tax=Desulfonatronum thiodismutans TaxID=159290 RepID=UPI001268608B|nr:hypothetical protein [Desulfonatronum thiodismutans]
MNTDQANNIEQAIDTLCENLVWTWAYLNALCGLSHLAKTSSASLAPYPQLVSCLYHGLFDVLFLKINHFIDNSRQASGLPALFRLIRKYVKDEADILQQVSEHERCLKEQADLTKISRWRNEVTAHLTRSVNSSTFYPDNRLHLEEIQDVVEYLAEVVEWYSLRMLGRVNDTKHPSEEVGREIAALFWGESGAEPPGGP